MEPEKKSNGALLGLVVIIIILLVGGVYIWQTNKNSLKTNGDGATTVNNEDASQLNTLDADINTTDTSTGVDVNSVN